MLRKLITYLLILFSVGATAGNILYGVAADGSTPKLIVVITVQDFNYDCYKQFYKEFGPSGFKKLQYNTNIKFNYLLSDYQTDIATIFTASEPCFNGIIGKKRYSAADFKQVMSLYDDKSKGVNDDLKLSGKAIMAMTFADKLYEESYGMSRLVSIAADPTTAMLAMGHSGLPIYMNNLTGEWSTSDYYAGKLPKWLDDYNATKPIEKYFDQKWENLYPAGYYITSGKRGLMGFSYDIRGVCNGIKMYENFATTPQCNEYICDLALKAIDEEKLGKDLTTDFLAINFSLSNFYLNGGESATLEREDAYLRLDQTLNRLLSNLVNKFSEKEVVIALIGSRTGRDNIREAVNKRIEYNSFNIDKYKALLNSYLMAFFGQKQWVLNCSSGSIYLNHSEISKEGISLKEIQDKAKEFFYLIPGVQNLVTSEEMEAAFYSTGKMRYPYYRNISGDLLYTLMPRWYEVDMKENPTGYFSSYETEIPLFTYGIPMVNESNIDATFLK